MLFYVAVALLSDLWKSHEGALSVQVLQEFYVTITKKVPSPIDSKTASGIIADLKQWAVYVPDADSILEAIAIHQQYNLSFWDSMIICSASRLKCDTIWSEDMNSGQIYKSVQVQSPFLEAI